ncbi:hypothetical protein COCSUDRAFT_32453 [Coccomyxa subellipsoidea C-169]|uniref:Uncharacterized protein n=1 Tax=Coccomyxa subellipsoidea (strain C-169) TaxID=574566 RepID=I0Z5S3_COCSC|nr:hypothetical protein COCSUDRAFT_32453 [Coccomyxa subellipsoidea C-169]EIE25992.1 hypothetical protein COCSUDRAFT_32453 [Coccomyxa subellipsoidea C-169]|eukprot:XP_005650536.1 hypothetical protein COCSUDRAFT_32453 [Coccomyxa subellipsoidea C-169]
MVHTAAGTLSNRCLHGALQAVAWVARWQGGFGWSPSCKAVDFVARCVLWPLYVCGKEAVQL